MNNVALASQTNPYTLSKRQQDANYNYGRATAAYEADPRYAAKQFQRAGLSSSAGTASLGAAASANAYAGNMSQAEASRLSDIYSNANLQLSDAASRSEFGNALAGLQDRVAHNDYLYRMRAMQNAMTPFGSANASSLLSGLY